MAHTRKKSSKKKPAAKKPELEKPAPKKPAPPRSWEVQAPDGTRIGAGFTREAAVERAGQCGVGYTAVASR